MVRSCDECQLNQANPPLAPLNPWSWPSRLWTRVDYAGPFQNHYFLIVIDAHSKWIEALPASTPSTYVTVELLCPLFAQFGLPKTIVTDNGSCFTSAEIRGGSRGASAPPPPPPPPPPPRGRNFSPEAKNNR